MNHHYSIIALNSKSTTSGISRTTSDLRNNALVPHQGRSGYLHAKCLHVCFPWIAALFGFHGYSTENLQDFIDLENSEQQKHPAFWFPSTSLNYHLFFGGWFLSSFCAPLIQPGPHRHIFGLVRQCMFLHDPLTHRNNFWSTKRWFSDSFTPLPSTKNISIYREWCVISMYFLAFNGYTSASIGLFTGFQRLLSEFPRLFSCLTLKNVRCLARGIQTWR